MLTDVTFNQNTSLAQVLAALAALDGGPKEPVRLSKGVYLAGNWNLHSVVREKIIEQYPKFSRGDIEWMTRLLTRNPDDSYLQGSFEATMRCPEVDLHRYENWVQNDDYDIDDNQVPGQRRQLSAYGVCDSPEQLLSLYDFEADTRSFFISFVEIRKDNQPSDGGWRWHKWGPYVGKQKPMCEYIYDEPDIKNVFTYHIYELSN